MSRLNLLNVSSISFVKFCVKKSTLISVIIVGVLFPLSAFAQSLGPERPLNSNKLPFLREASSGGDLTSDASGLSGTSGDDATTNGSGVETTIPVVPVPIVKVPQGGLESQAHGCRFRDISGHGSENAINYLYDKGVAGGRRPCYFEPDAAITRAEVTTMVVRATETTLPESPAPAAFPDTNVNSWSAKHVKAAKNADVVHGYPDGLFKADKPANVVETLKISTRAFDSDFSSIDLEKLSEIKDIALDQWYIKYVQAGFNEGLIVDGATYIAPASEVTRAEAAEIIYILMTKREDN